MGRILVVDDNPLNRELLRAYLEPVGHDVVEADSGEAALAQAMTAPPDLVLLDVMMPGLDGFETAKRLKEQSSGFLPIVMVTALSDSASRVRGLQHCADEFLTKPVDRFEILARVGNLLKLRESERELHRRNTRLIDLQRFRDEMAELIVHDLKNPMAVVMSNLEFLLEDPRMASLPELREAVEDARRGGHRALRLLSNLLDLARLEANRMVLLRMSISLPGLLTPILDQRARIFELRGIALEVDLPEDAVWVDVELLTRTIENILDNAVRYTPTGGRIRVSGGPLDAGKVLVAIANSGSTIPEDARERIFEKFGRAEGAQRTNLGLGLYFCRLAIEAHNGRLWLDGEPEFPTVFKMSLPVPAAAGG